MPNTQVLTLPFRGSDHLSERDRSRSDNLARACSRLVDAAVTPIVDKKQKLGDAIAEDTRTKNIGITCRAETISIIGEAQREITRERAAAWTATLRDQPVGVVDLSARKAKRWTADGFVEQPMFADTNSFEAAAALATAPAVLDSLLKLEGSALLDELRSAFRKGSTELLTAFLVDNAPGVVRRELDRRLALAPKTNSKITITDLRVALRREQRPEEWQRAAELDALAETIAQNAIATVTAFESRTDTKQLEWRAQVLELVAPLRSAS